ncbi:MAG: nitroreductase family protein [Chloroflexi bacterium]|nr:nitroreductase family protein [Chloroflexota bacterium]MCY3697637.1 nitroreductase family protein [Chloroflexota bacterium]
MSNQTTDIYEVMQTQRAIRRWTDEPVDRDTIERIIQAACWAPSGSNSQPWGFLVVTDDGIRQRLATAIREMFSARFSGDMPNPDDIDDPTTRRMMRGAFNLFDNFAAAPVWIIPCLVRPESPAPSGLLAGSSIYPSIQNLMLAARAEGLGTVLTTPQDGIMDQLRAELNIPDKALPVAMIPMGHPNASFGPVARKPLHEFLHWNGWND